MPEQRARTYHRNRVASTFSEEIGAMLEGELSDPRIAPSYVTDVVLAPGGKSARVFVAVHGSEAEEASTLAGLMTARGFIRSQIRERMGVRHVPELTFAIDRSERMTGRMDELLGRMRKREKSREKSAAAVAGAVSGLDPTHRDSAAMNGAQEPEG
jgi:ribosome-binding factor A